MTTPDRNTPSPTSTESSLLLRPPIATVNNQNAPDDAGSSLLPNASQDENSEGARRSGAGKRATNRRRGDQQRHDAKSDQSTTKGRMKRSIGFEDDTGDDEIYRDSDAVRVQKFALEELMDRAKRLIAGWTTSDDETKQRRQISDNQQDDVCTFILVFVSPIILDACLNV
jgi:hypothetical protein